MIIKKLKQYHFRNLRESSIEFDKNVSLFIGNNGQGKTNILEAIYVALNGKSFRPGKMEHLVCKNEKLGFVELDIVQGDLCEKVKLELKEASKKTYLNAKTCSSQKIQAQFPLVLFSPESLMSIKEGPELRRNLVDDLLVSHHPQNIQLLADFAKALKTRNKLLKDHLAEKIHSQQFYDVISSLDQSYLPLAAKLSSQRIQALKGLEEDFCQATQFILDLKNVDIALDYFISGHSALHWGDKEIYYALLKRREQLEQAEKDSGTTLFGPQRHDIQFLFNQEDARYYCSQGQQRAL
ncbi:MAG: DNA replication and repair protein RecF, partial [Bdellovibrionales bacterium]|nr:DNA replication and repair protein RecF [Bdellovibrionales bacterium]